MNYDKVFNKRGKFYKYAIEKYPEVLKHEFETAVDICSIKNTDIIINMLAACVPLDRYFKVQPQKYIEYDTNLNFAELMGIKYCTLYNIPESNISVDTIISLAGLHHSTQDERVEFYKECYRILKNNTGRLIIGDVIKNSKEAIWLNVFVNKYNSSGHNGIFWDEYDKNFINENGFNTRVEIRSYPWIFKSDASLLDFVKNLFCLDLASDAEIIAGIDKYLHPVRTNKQININWQLIYFISTKCQNISQYCQNTTDYQHLE